MYVIDKSRAVYFMDKGNAPALSVPSGSTVVFETADCFSDQIKSEDHKIDGIDWNKINPATGPLYVEGAEPGDVLAVSIEEIEIDEKGIVMVAKDLGVLGSILTENAIKIVPIKEGVAHFSDTIHIPVEKMIGVIGVAPAGEAITNGAPDYHGGNMDCKEIREGAKLFLPVSVPGGLLALGDLHGAMADGEVGGSGLELCGKVTLTVEVIKKHDAADMPTPMILNDTHIMTLHSDVSLDVAVDTAVGKMADYLVKTKGFTLARASMLLSLAGQAKICQVVDPKKTARVELARDLLQ